MTKSAESLNKSALNPSGYVVKHPLSRPEAIEASPSIPARRPVCSQAFAKATSPSQRPEAELAGGEELWTPVGEPALLRDPLAEEASMSWTQPVPQDKQASLQGLKASLQVVHLAVQTLHLQVRGC